MPLDPNMDLEKLTDNQLLGVHWELHLGWAIYQKHGEYTTKEGKSFSKEDFYNLHKLVVQEMNKRGVEHRVSDSFDKISLKAFSVATITEGKIDRFGQCKELVFSDGTKIQNIFDTGIEIANELIKRNVSTVYTSQIGGKSKQVLEEHEVKIQITKDIPEEFKTLGETIPPGEEITLEEILPYFKPFAVVDPLVYIAGGIVDHGHTTEDINILVRTMQDDPINLPIMSKILKLFPEKYRDRVQFLFEDTYKHDTSHIPLYKVEAILNGSLETSWELQIWPGKEGKFQYVVQGHFRGKSFHHDFRVKINDFLEGWTLFSQPKGKVTEEPDTIAKAKGIVNKIDWKWPKVDTHCNCGPKSKQPVEWINKEKVFGPGEVGASKEKTGTMVILDKGTLELGARKAWFHEYFVNSSFFKGRLIFRRISETQGRPTYWNSWITKDETPYVLSNKAVRDGWIPPTGWSCIPSYLRKKIPVRYQFWKESGRAKRIDMRNELVKDKEVKLKVLSQYDSTHFLVVCDENKMCLAETLGEVEEIKELSKADCTLTPAYGQTDNDFYLLHHWWRGQFVARGASLTEHWDLIIPPDIMFVIADNPLKGSSTSLQRKVYSKNFWLKGSKQAEYIKPGTPGNPAKDTPCWAERVDSGKVTILEKGDLFMRFRFKGKKISGTYTLSREDPNTNLWKFGKMELPKGTTKELSANEEIVQTTMNLAIDGWEDVTGGLLIKGGALSYGVWNGEYYPPHVVADRPERIKGVPLGIGSHYDPTNVGVVKEYEFSEKECINRTESFIPEKEKEAIKRVKNGEFAGQSVEVRVRVDKVRKIINKIVGYDRLVLVDEPACKVCTIDGICPT